VIPTSANAFTLDVDTTTFGAFAGQTITVTTRAPLTTKAIWSIKTFIYDATGHLVLTAYRADPSTASLVALGSGETTFAFPCTAPVAFQ
jgi:hypothetical protein